MPVISQTGWKPVLLGFYWTRQRIGRCCGHLYGIRDEQHAEVSKPKLPLRLRSVASAGRSRPELPALRNAIHAWCSRSHNQLNRPSQLSTGRLPLDATRTFRGAGLQHSRSISRDFPNGASRFRIRDCWHGRPHGCRGTRPGHSAPWSPNQQGASVHPRWYRGGTHGRHGTGNHLQTGAQT